MRPILESIAIAAVIVLLGVGLYTTVRNVTSRRVEPPAVPAPQVLRWYDSTFTDPDSGWTLKMQVGLREDGALVWRTGP